MSVAHLLVEPSLRAVPILGVVLLLQRTLNRQSPEARGLVLLASLLAVWSVPLVQRVVPGLVVPGMPRVGSTASTVVALVWLVGSVALLIRIGWSLLGLRRLVRRAVAAGRTISIPGRRVRVVVSEGVAAPMAVGLVRPVVLLPPGWRGCSRRVRRGVLAHEFAHLRNGDPWRRLLGETTRALHWPNPLVWWVVRVARLASEEAADRAALRSGIGASDWADALLGLARRSPAVPGPATSLTSELAVRVEALVSRPRPTWESRRPYGLLALVGLLPALVAIPEAPTGSRGAPAAFAERWGIDGELADRVWSAAEAEGVDPALAFALIQVESGFDPRRVSPSGAVGYTQILPATAMALEAGLDPARLYDETVNLRLGLRYFRNLQARFPHEPERAILAYGEGVGAAAARRDPLRAGYVQAVLRAAGIRRS